MRFLSALLLATVTACSTGRHVEPTDLAKRPTVREICDWVWRLRSISDLRRSLGRPLADDIGIFPNPLSEGEFLPIHEIEFSNAMASIFDAPRDATFNPLRELSVTGPGKDNPAERWIGLSEVEVTQTNGPPETGERDQLSYDCESDAEDEISFWIKDKKVSSVSWYLYLDGT